MTTMIDDIKKEAADRGKIAKENSLLRKQVNSAKAWQDRGWVKRAFHKWRVPTK